MIKELLERNSITYRESGKDYLIRCLNPDHDDRNPSMRIDKLTGIFGCFSCGFKGSLLKYFGAPSSPIELHIGKLREKIKKQLHESVGVPIPEDAIPFASDWRGISAGTYKKFGAFEHHSLAGRIVFPITSASGKVTCLVGRHTSMEGNPRYLNYPSGVTIPLFPQVTPITGRVILVEGLFDMLNLHDKGLTNAIAAFGTNSVNEAKLDILKARGVTGIDIIFDGDDAGRKAAASLKELCQKKEFSVTVTNLKDGEDPGDFSEEKVKRLHKHLYGGS